ncbi:CDF family Co(II)/Ni(II) efflux transporter DmeF [bacterium]|nr:CDF family Co(II)/Ni(II) efflux transporter DmeF [bacterium]
MKCDVLHKDISNQKNQTKTSIVIIITAIMMVAEIAAGLIYGSMALLSDGIHMGTHALALLITLFAYIITKKNAENTKFTFGTGKIGVLGGYTSAIVLLIAALVMIWESFHRIIDPVDIGFNQSLLVAVIGLIVNFVSALLLKDDHGHSHGHSHDHGHDHNHHDEHEHKEDHNLKAAYLHVIADALTSVGAIIALLGAKYMGWIWLDPVVGIVGAIIVIKWGIGLLKTTGKILVDYDDDQTLKDEIINLVKSHKLEITDIHIWDILNGDKAVMCSVKTQDLEKCTAVKKEILENKKIKHLTVECV